MSRALLSIGALATLSLGGAACAPDRSFAYAQTSDLQGDSSATVALNASSSVVRLDEGSAVSVHVQIVAKDGENISGDLAVADPTTLLLETAPSDAQRYVFLGVKSGTTSLSITVNGNVVSTVPVTVVAPPAYTPPGWLVGADAGVVPPPDADSDAASDGGDAGAADDASNDAGDAAG
jgi:hypothetical protein